MTQKTYTLTDIARRLGAEQHRLIHLCEKEVVLPDYEGATGRGSSRRFSGRNLLEFSIALRLRKLQLPLASIRGILYVLRAFEAKVAKKIPGIALPESLREASAPDLRIIVSDGEAIYFTLEAKLFYGMPLLTDSLAHSTSGPSPKLRPVTPAKRRSGRFGGPESSQFMRLEISVTEIAKALPLD